MIRRTSIPDKIWKLHENRNAGRGRAHLGASLIGHECDRYLYLTFRWALPTRFPGRVLRIFKRGFTSEQEVNEELRAIGLTVNEIDPKTGEQYRFELFNGHFAGSCDGLVHGIEEAPRAVHVLEEKTANQNNFKKIVKGGVEVGKPQHFIQMQIYMQMFDCKRALYICVNKNDEDIYDERIAYDASVANDYIARARRLITIAVPPERLPPTDRTCKYCDFNSVCHGEEIPVANCRTCAHSTPQVDKDSSPWICEKFDNAPLSIDVQRAGDKCPGHVYNPYVVPGWLNFQSSDERGVIYKLPTGGIIINSSEPVEGLLHFPSPELWKANPEVANKIKLTEDVFSKPDERGQRTLVDPTNSLPF